MRKWIELAVIVAFIAAAIAVVDAAYVAWSQCAESGGRIVRGLFWLECIK